MASSRALWVLGVARLISSARTIWAKIGPCMNFRVQVLDRSGAFKYAVGRIGDAPGTMFRPKGIGLDSEGDLYVVDGLWGVVQVFNRDGNLLYYFGNRVTGAGEFQLPAGLFIDHNDR